MKKKNLLLLLINLIAATILNAQLPNTDILLFKRINPSENFYSKPINITNRIGYDNQPSFSPDSKELLFVSVIDTNQSDVWIYDIKKKSKRQVTNTKVSEYSPTFINGGNSISVVRVDADSGQRFYILPFPTTQPEKLINNTDSIGYSCWINDHTIAMFLVGDTNTLQILNMETGLKTKIANEPGRCIKVNPKNKLVYYVEKKDSVNWFLMKLDPVTLKSTQVVKMLKGSEDFAFFSNGLLASPHETTLFKLDEPKQAWYAIDRLTLPIEQNFFRIAISPDDSYIAVVVKMDDDGTVKK